MVAGVSFLPGNCHTLRYPKVFRRVLPPYEHQRNQGGPGRHRETRAEQAVAKLPHHGSPDKLKETRQALPDWFLSKTRERIFAL